MYREKLAVLVLCIAVIAVVAMAVTSDVEVPTEVIHEDSE